MSVRHGLDVGACGKDLIRSGQNDTADLVIADRFHKDPGQLFAHCAVQRVSSLWAIDANENDALSSKTSMFFLPSYLV